MRLSAILVGLMLLLPACTPRGQLTLYEPSGVAQAVGSVQPIFVGTMRKDDAATGLPGADRTEALAFQYYEISVPPNRKPGEITWPRGRTLDPATDFLTTREHMFDGAGGFRSAMSDALRRGSADREVVVFVHGFNNTFSEGLYRIAQLREDLDLPGVAVHYSWPSLGKPLGYAYDRDSVLFSRDGFEKLLDEIAAAGADRIVIVAHSMGAALAMETMRQMSINGRSAAYDRISGVLLMSPDIDVDVFRTQALRMGDLPQPFLIFTSSKDRALGLAGRLTGRTQRLGSLEDVSKVADLKVTLLDVGAFSDGSSHFAPATSPLLLQLLGRLSEVNQAFDRDRAGRTDLFSGTVLTLQSATQIILSPVAVLTGQGYQLEGRNVDR